MTGVNLTILHVVSTEPLILFSLRFAYVFGTLPDGRLICARRFHVQATHSKRSKEGHGRWSVISVPAYD